MPELAVTVDRSADRLRLTLTGTVDLTTRDTLINVAIRELEVGPVAVLEFDTHRLDFCDSSGISGFLAVRRIAEEHGAQVVLTNPSAQLARLLAVTGLREHFD